MDPDEGMINQTEEIGNYGPYKQSLRREIYQAYAKKFIEMGKAYPCFCSPEELDELRKNKKQQELEQDIMEYGQNVEIYLLMR